MNRRISALCAVMLAAALMVTFFGHFMGEPLLSFADESKCVYLTFDDGPSDRVTPKILDVLKEEKVCATFFVVGRNAESRKGVLKREFEEGHTIGVHSYSHKYSQIYSSTEALKEDIKRCNDIICSVTGEFSHIYRFPGGSFSVGENFKRAVKELGLNFVDWNASFCDSEIKDATAGKLYSAALSTVSNPKKIIILAHDGTDKIYTPDALKEVIMHFKKLNYVFKKF